MPIIDAQVYRELQETAGADFVRELVDTFLQEAPGMLAELRSACQAKAADRFRRAAHSLKSNAQTFGACDLSQRSRELESGWLPSDCTALDAVEGAYKAAATTLQEMARA